MTAVPRIRFAIVRLIALASLALAAIQPSITGLAAHEAPKMSARTPLAETQLVQSVRQADPECYCWANGQRFAHGEQACIRGGGATRLARCDREINVMSWSFSAEPCPES